MYAKCTRNVREMYGYPTVTPQGHRGLHFRGRRPIYRASLIVSARSCASRPLVAAAQPRDVVRGAEPAPELRQALRRADRGPRRPGHQRPEERVHLQASLPVVDNKFNNRKIVGALSVVGEKLSKKLANICRNFKDL